MSSLAEFMHMGSQRGHRVLERGLLSKLESNFMGGGRTSWLVGLCEERGRWGLLTAERESFSLPYSLRYGLLNSAL